MWHSLPQEDQAAGSTKRPRRQPDEGSPEPAVVVITPPPITPTEDKASARPVVGRLARSAPAGPPGGGSAARLTSRPTVATGHHGTPATGAGGERSQASARM